MLVPTLPLVAAVALVAAGAAQPTPPPAPPPPRCDAPEHRQFDFWLGEWNVYEGEALAGTNRIETILDGCALRESWVGSSGMRGTSLNSFSPRDRRWHQTWVDSNGLLLELAGTFENGRIELAGRVPQPDGAADAMHRITWEPRADGTVRQHWQASRDGGVSWSDVFDGIYRQRRGDRPPPLRGSLDPPLARTPASATAPRSR